jgi:hypothetical protein
MSRLRIGLAAALLGVLAMGAATLAGRWNGHPTTAATTAAGVTATNPLSARQGKLVYLVDFKDPSSGWASATLPSGTTFQYADGGYVIVGRGYLHHFADSPFVLPESQLLIAVTAKQSAGAPAGAGFGVTCWRGDGPARIRYEFILLAPATWYLERDFGTPTADSRGVVLRKGTVRTSLGHSTIMLTGVCASLPGGATRVALFIDGGKVVDLTDSASPQPGSGWLSGIDVSSRNEGVAAVTASLFEERDISW